jgi:hypothetical protein
MTRKKQNDTSNPVDMTKGLSTSILRKNLAKMEQDNVALSQTVDKLLAELESRKSEIEHLKKLLTGSNESNIIRIEVTEEEHIAELQLERLKKKAEVGELTLEEVKKYDLLVKNKRLAKGDPTTVNADYRKLPAKSEERTKLLSLAASPMDRDLPDDE